MIVVVTIDDRNCLHCLKKYCNLVQLDLLQLLQGICLNRIINSYRIMIATHAINDGLIHQLKTNNHIRYKSNESIIIVYRLNTNIILVFLAISYHEFDVNSYKTDIFDPISNTVGTFDEIVCIINVNNTIVYFIDNLSLVIKLSMKYFVSFSYGLINIIVNVVLMTVTRQFAVKVNKLNVFWMEHMTSIKL